MIRQIREIDTKSQLTIVANGVCNQGVQSRTEFDLYTKAGANACSLYSNIFTKGPVAVEEILSQDKVEVRKEKVSEKI